MSNQMSTDLRFCRIVLLLIPLFLGALLASGQVSGEYYWNSDPGIGRATRMTDSGEAEGYHNFTLDASGLRPGMNMLGMRAFSGGRWTQTLYNFVMVPADPKATVWSGEYFWDTDPGVGKATAISSGTFAGEGFVADISAEGLGAGAHTLGLRVNSGGAWSHTHTYIVVVPAAPHEAEWRAEYYWDTDPGVGKATPLTVALGPTGGMVDVDVLTEGLAAGQHTIGIRTCSGRAWSSTVTSVITIPDERSSKIIGAEYFWGDDPGFGNGTPVAVDEGNEVAVEVKDIDFPQTVADEYVLSFRARSTHGWGTTVTKVIPHLYVDTIAMSAESNVLPVGSTMQIKADITPVDAFNAELEWTSSDASVATVDADGSVTGIAPGSVTITAASTDGSEVSASVDITVLVPVAAITLSENELILEVSRTATLGVVVSPAEATNQNVDWTIEGDNCITVSEKGVVTAVAVGEARIIVSAADSCGARAECYVRVVPLRGDADGSGMLAVNDVVLTARGVVGDVDEKLVFEAVDLNGDTELTVGDLTGVVAAVLDYTVPASEEIPFRVAGGYDTKSGTFSLDVDGMNVALRSGDYTRYSGIQFDVAVTEGLNVTDAVADNLNVALARKDGLTRVLAYAADGCRVEPGNALARIMLDAEPTAAAGAYDVELTNVMASDFDGNLYHLGNCRITVFYDPVSGLRTAGAHGLKISVEGHKVLIESPVDTVVTFTEINGISRQIEIKAGINTMNVEKSGGYIINDRKIIIR